MITIISLKAKLVFDNQEDKQSLLGTLRLTRDAFNFCADKHFGSSRNSIIDLHAKCYKAVRTEFGLKSAFVVQTENAVLSAYRSIKANRHKIYKPIVKKKLSISLNKSMVRLNNNNFYITTQGRRVKVKLSLYPRLQQHLDKYKFGDVTIFVMGEDIYMSLPFKVETEKPTSGTALGVDLGIRRLAATSEGNIYIDRKFNAEKRRLRYLKRMLNSKKLHSNSAKKKLKKLSKKEQNKNVNLIHHLANKVLQTKANYIVLEDLSVKKMKSKKHKNQNKNKISQISFSQLKHFLTYKAALLGKEVVCVNPAFTSQTNCITGKREGERKGCRFAGINPAHILDADVNAAINIARKSKLPVSQGNPLDGQTVVNRSIVD